MRSVRDIPSFENIPILVRASLNEPIANGIVADTFRLTRTAPTLRFLAEQGARVVVISHIGELGTETLAPVAKALGELVRGVSFCPYTVGSEARAAVRGMTPSSILVMENLRRNAGEKKNDPAFAKALAELGDAFVEDSFDTCHRAHASIVGVPELLPSYAGLQLEAEVAALTDAKKPKHPAFAVVGGAKFGTKEAVLEALLPTYDRVFVGGALANDFIQALGQEVGQSLTSGVVDPTLVKLAHHPKLLLPLDSVVVKKAALGTPDAKRHARVAKRGDVRPDEVILDHGPETVALLAAHAHDAETVLWNGPLGNYENGFVDATDAFARAVASSGAHSIVGGGDTITAIQKLGVLDKFSFVSTGGGAMLDFLAKGTLPGIAALDKAPNGA